MTNSTTNQESTKPKKKKDSKPKGPLRTGALVSLLVVMVLGFVFAKFFLDHTIKKTIEWSASYLHGAEVDVARVQTKILAGEVHIYGLAVTDKKKVTHNVFAIEHIRFDLLMDAIMRAKIVIEDASLTGLTLDTLRSRPGRLYKATEKEEKKSKQVKEAGKKVAGLAAKELEDNVLGNIASIASGDKAKDQLQNIRGGLGSEAKIKEIEEQLTKKEKIWDEKLKSFKHNDDLKNLNREIKGVKYNKKKPWKSIKRYADLSKAVSKKIKQYKQDAKTLKSDISYFEKSIKEVKSLAKGDFSSLGDRFSLSGVDGKSLATIIFMKLLQEQSGEYYKYILAARDYLPSKKDKSVDETEQLIPRKRGQGRTFQYPITTSYPFFWWRKGDLSMNSADANITGTIRDVSSDPTHLKKVAILKLAGSLPKHHVKKFRLDGEFDHRQKKNVDTIKVVVQDMPVSNKRFFKNEKLTFGLDKAKSSWNIHSQMHGEDLTFIIKGLFTDTSYQVESQNKAVKDIFGQAVENIPNVAFNAKGTGKWGDLDWRIKSDFANQLTRNIKKQVSRKIDEAKKKYIADLKGKLGPQTKRLEDKYAQIKSKFDGLLNKQKQGVDQIANKALKGTKGKANAPTKKLENKAKDLFKKFKF